MGFTGRQGWQCQRRGGAGIDRRARVHRCE